MWINHKPFLSFNINITDHDCFLLLTNPKAEQFAALLRRLDTQNKLGVSPLVSVKVKIKAATSFVQN